MVVTGRRRGPLSLMVLLLPFTSWLSPLLATLYITGRAVPNWRSESLSLSLHWPIALILAAMPGSIYND